MTLVYRYLSAAVRRIRPALKPAGLMLSLLTLCAIAPAAFVRGTSGALPSERSARVSLVGLDLYTSNGSREARERIRTAARDLCARNPGQRPLNSCVDDVTAAAEQQIKARTTLVSLADLDLGTPGGVHAARDRLQAAAQRVCQEPHAGNNVALTQYLTCVDKTFAHALRQADLPGSGALIPQSFKER